LTPEFEPLDELPRLPFLVIAGATATGKSEIALEVAARLGGEIVIADSRQVYRGLDIGTAKPSRAERARVPHHLIDVVDVGRPYNAADYARDARAALRAIEERGRVGIVCGGTGFYVAALVGSLDELPGPPADARGRLESVPAADRYAVLAGVDPAIAERLHPRDRQRIDRALSFWYQTGEPLSAWQRGGAATPLACVGVAITRPRNEVHARIDGRLDRMLAAGLEDEARGFWEAGRTPADPGLDTIGYQEWWPYFEGEIERDEVRDRILAATRQYAKRQATWFRHQGAYRRVAADQGVEAVLAAWRSRSEADP
jgi:tRNA dimethylallyltransferase